MLSVKFNHNTIFYILFIQTKINEQTKPKKTVVRFHESFLVYLLGCETASHVNFWQHTLALYSSCYFLALQRVILEYWQKQLTSGN